MGNLMIESVKPVRLGILIGLFGVLFGISWALWLVVGHERIHQSLEARAALAEKVTEARMLMDSTHQVEAPKAEGHKHNDGSLHRHEPVNAMAAIAPQEPDHHQTKGAREHDNHESVEALAATAPQEPDHHQIKGGQEHDDPLMALAHTRFVRGHLHAMGLGLATVLISLVIAFTTASARVKTIASVLTGLGGIIYPFAWIVMGYMTPSLGPEAAEASAVFIAGPGVGLVLLGVFIPIGYTLRDVFKRT